ncbi:ribosome-binding factor A [Paludibacter sp. 221]|uniref:ribosome-binding factor A n=1 Tax=Paludibacter sp. 221 TaxID=2302939 RepID=UPI0013D03C2A|nr:ribosome-binding factor A [Paludibacter sp. 221]NDV47749.1 ribosome-binding factor A [Paludibacter sp. 221]
METTRQQKIARLLQKELGDIFIPYARQIPGTLITVTNARISPDLSISHIHISIFPTERAAEVLSQINEDKKAIRYDLGTRIRHQVRLIPELVFHIDDSLDYVENIDRLLQSDPPSPVTDEETDDNE